MSDFCDAENLNLIPIRLTCQDGVWDIFHVHTPIAPFPSVCSFHTDWVLTRANAIYYEDYSKSPMKSLSLKAKEIYALVLVEVKEKSLKQQEEQDQMWFSSYCFKQVITDQSN